MNDPTRTWTKISGLGPATLSSRETLWTLYLAGGGIMHPIALCMVVVIVVGINGLFILRRKTHYPLPFVTKSRECLLKGDVDGFKQLSAGERGLLGYICRAMTDESDSAGGLSLEAMQERSEMEANKQINRLRIPLKTLNVIAAVAPMLGLLGTVIGMVQCFEAIAFESASASKALTLAAGIRVALFTTVAGLLVAIPALIVMFLLNQKLNGIVSDTEIAASKFAHMIAKGAGAKPVADSVAPKA
jgi:biopolymer transport protein ExbB